MFHFDRIQRKLLLIMGALILLLSAGLIYSETRNRRGVPSEATFTEQQFWGEPEETPSPQPDDNAALATQQPKTIQIYITGQVIWPGVYSLSTEQRLVDAIEQAGGCTTQADLTRINLAAKVMDEAMYYIPAFGEEITPNLSITQANGETEAGKVNINLADQSQLESLPGIGPVKAGNILEYRDQHGGFQSIEEIMNVTGIAEKTFENIKEQITIK